MSGYIAAFRFDDGEVDALWFAQLAERIRMRGPDRFQISGNGPARFAHSLLITTPESKAEEQPIERDSRTFVGQLRVDDRARLAQRCGAAAGATDPEIAFAAHDLLGDRFVEELIGDFSFVIHDRAARSAICVRDHFARRPLYYAQWNEIWIVTNTLPALLAVPELEAELDEEAIADFLLFGRNLDGARTSYARIRRVPAAHLLRIDRNGPSLRRYWEIPNDEEPLRKKESEVHEQFRELLSLAVRDRSRAERVVLSLSGGLDSNAVAATLVSQKKSGVSAVTTVWREDFVDHEGRFAQIAADAYGIPIEFHVADRCIAYDKWSEPRVRGYEPTDEPCSAAFFTFASRLAERARVVLTGEGGDPALYTSHDYFFTLLTRFQWLRFVREAASYVRTRRRRPPLLLRSQLKLALGIPFPTPRYPEWLDPEFERRHQLRERWRQIYTPPRERLHPFRSSAKRVLESASWSRTFEASDAGVTGIPLEWCSPYFDVRLIDFLFRIAPMPHFADKDLVRRSMKGLIPAELLERPKSPLPVDPSALRLQVELDKRANMLHWTQQYERFVDPQQLHAAIRTSSGGDYWSMQQGFAIGLSIWLNEKIRKPLS